MTDLDKCIARLLYLEGEVKSLRSKVEEGGKVKQRMELMEQFLTNRFDYYPSDEMPSAASARSPRRSGLFRDPGKTKFSATKAQPNVQSHSQDEDSKPNRDNMNGKYWHRKPPPLVNNGPSASVPPPPALTQRTTRFIKSAEAGTGSGYQNQNSGLHRSEDSTSRPRGLPTLKTRRDFIPEPVVEIETAPDEVKIKEEVKHRSWRETVEEDIRREMEEGMREMPDMNLNQDGEESHEALPISGDEWEIYNSEEEFEVAPEDQFKVIGYESDELQTGDYDAGEDDNMEEYTQFGEPSSTSASSSNTNKPSFPSRFSILKTSFASTSSPSASSTSSTSMPAGRGGSSSSSSVHKSNNSAHRPKLRLATIIRTVPGGAKSVQEARLQLLHNSPDPKRPNCPYCGKPFNTPAEMMRHQRIHIGDKPFACYLCEYATSFNGDLVRHLKSRHPGNDPYVCHICGFKCKELLMFTDHRRRTGHGGRGANRRYQVAAAVQ